MSQRTTRAAIRRRVIPAFFSFASLGVVGTVAAQTTPRVPTVIWKIEAEDDTPLVLPYGTAVSKPAHAVYVADLRTPGVVEIDGDSGKVRRVIGREGDGPGEMRVPQRITISPDGKLVAVYDVGRRSVDIFDSQWRFLRRDPVGGFNFLKSLGVANDTAIVLAGGMVGTGQFIVGVTWVTPGGVFGLPPYPPDDPEMEEGDRLDSRLYAGGGPGQFVGNRYLVADALTGDLWQSVPTGSTKIAQGPVPGLEALRTIIRRTTGANGPIRNVNFAFRQAVLVEPTGDGAIVYFSDDANELVQAYRVRHGRAAELIASWKLRTSTLTRYDDQSLIAVDHFIGGWRISRVAIPKQR
jgi:hypothetical protein